MKKTDCILLVDDSLSTNFYNRKLIEKSKLAHEILDVTDGFEALDYLKNEGKYIESHNPKPNIIFLDINMPKMNGFEFLEEYNKISKKKTEDIVIVLLTTSNWSKDKTKSIDTNLVFEFIEKPLLIEDIQRVTKHYQKTYESAAVNQ